MFSLYQVSNIPGQTQKGDVKGRGRDRSDPSTRQGMPRMAAITRSQEEARRDSSLEPSEWAWPCQHLHFRIPASRPEREYISVVLNHLVRSKLLQLPQETTIDFGKYFDQPHFKGSWLTVVTSSTNLKPLEGSSAAVCQTFLQKENLGHKSQFRSEGLSHLPWNYFFAKQNNLLSTLRERILDYSEKTKQPDNPLGVVQNI